MLLALIHKLAGNQVRARLVKDLLGELWKRGRVGWRKSQFLILCTTHSNSQVDFPQGLRRKDSPQGPWNGWSVWGEPWTVIMHWGPPDGKWAPADITEPFSVICCHLPVKGQAKRGTRTFKGAGVPLDCLTPPDKCSVVQLPAWVYHPQLMSPFVLVLWL